MEAQKQAVDATAVVLTFRDGRLLWPEVVHVVGPDEVEFRGKLWTV